MKTENWYGIPGILFIYHNEWTDPEIEYKGKRCSVSVVEDTMLERWGDAAETDDPEDFIKYMQLNADDVYELCELALFPEVYK